MHQTVLLRRCRLMHQTVLLRRCRLMHQTVLLRRCNSCAKIMPHLTNWSVPSTVVQWYHLPLHFVTTTVSDYKLTKKAEEKAQAYSTYEISCKVVQRISTEQLSAAGRPYFAVNYETSYLHILMIEMLAEVSVFTAIQRKLIVSKRVTSGVVYLSKKLFLQMLCWMKHPVKWTDNSSLQTNPERNVVFSN